MAPKQPSKDKLWKIYDKLPQELQKAIFSEETADDIFNVCEKNGVEEVSEVAYYAGLVLMGFLLPQEFEKVLQKEINIPKDAAKEIAREINRFVFYPVKPALEQLHQMEIKVEAKIVTPKPEEKRKEQPSEKSSGPDRYREEKE